MGVTAVITERSSMADAAADLLELGQVATGSQRRPVGSNDGELGRFLL